MKLFRRKPPTIPDDPATEKQIDYIKQLAVTVGPYSKSVLKKYKINPDLTNPEAFTYLDKARAGMCIESLLSREPATDNQRATLAHKGGDSYTGLSRDEQAVLDRAWEIASPSGDPENPASYRHLSKKTASEAIGLLIDGGF
jgi:hypothetical protein